MLTKRFHNSYVDSAPAAQENPIYISNGHFVLRADSTIKHLAPNTFKLPQSMPTYSDWIIPYTSIISLVPLLLLSFGFTVTRA